MGKLDIKTKVTKIERGEIYEEDGKYRRKLDFFNGDLKTFSILLKADTKDALKIMKVVDDEDEDDDVTDDEDYE